MTASLAARRPLVFAALAVAAVAAEYAVVASRGFALHPTGFSAAVIFDLVVGLPLAWWLLVVRPGAARPRTLVPVALAGLAVAAALLPGERGLLRGLRFLAIPAEVALVAAALRRFSGARGDLPDRLPAALGGGPVARLAANELAILGLALFSWRSRPEPGTLSVHRRSGWTAVCVAVLFMSLPETAGLHLLIARWSPSAAWAATALGAYGVVWLLGDLRALQLRGVSVAGGLLRIRIGLRREVDVPPLTLRLREPVEIRSLFGRARNANALALQIDDPAALRALLAS